MLKSERATYRGHVKVQINGVEADLEQVDLTSEGSSSSDFFDKDRNFVRGTDSEGFEIVAEPKATAMARSSATPNIYEETRVVPNKRIPDGLAISFLHLSVSASDVDLSVLPSDEHQTIEKVGNEWDIKVHPPKLSLFDETTIAVAQAGQEQWLRPDVYVPCDDAQFKTLAGNILGSERRLGRATMLIAGYVSSRMKPTMGIEVLRDASEILKTKEGVCRDYSVLTLTLLRAAGIPSKLVTGLVSWDGDYYYHEWIQVWDGTKWIGVDAMAPESQISATHIEFASGTFAEATRRINPRFQHVRVVAAVHVSPSKYLHGPTPSNEEIGWRPPSPDAQKLIDEGGKLLAANKDKLAEADYRKAVLLDPDSAYTHYALCMFYYDREQALPADAVFRAALAKWPNNYTLLFMEGYVAEELGDYARSEQLLLDGLKNDPDRLQYYAYLGMSCFMQHKYVSAANAYREWILAQPLSAAAHASLASALAAIRDLPGAEAEDRKAIQIDANYGPAYAGLSATRFAQGKYVDAERLARKAIALERKYQADDTRTQAQTLYYLGESIARQGRKREAQEFSKQAQKLYSVKS